MKLVLATFGTTGDVQPFLALGVELIRRGHAVLLAAPPNFAARAQATGLAFCPLGAPVDDPQSLRLFASAYEMEGAVDQVRATLAVPLQHAEASLPALMDAARGADLLVSIPYQPAGRICAERLGLPYISVHFSPFGSTRRPKLSAVAAPAFNALRAAHGLGPLAEPLGQDGISPTLALTPVSPSIFPRPPSWPPRNHVTGFWFLDESYTPDPGLQAFVEAGEPPVVIGFGSLTHRDPAALTQVLLDAVERAGVRAVIQSGWSGLALEDPPPHVRFASFIPHPWLFPRAACVVHGGGAGTTAAVLRAGVPSVFVPHWLDQHLWGALALERNLASACLPLKELDAANLAAAIRAAAAGRIREACVDMARRVRAEAGVAAAVDLLEAVGPACRGTGPLPGLPDLEPHR